MDIFGVIGSFFSTIQSFIDIVVSTFTYLGTVISDVLSSFTSALTFASTMFECCPPFLHVFLAASFGLAIIAVVVKFIPFIG